ncbi:hypothetical protein A9264_02270 [Vibrio sp. UCD-FRSSP16_10]|uniref:hypothetical protein n=1 Tax=unclassified Vibrio TaxID=2614977 RepID=UPI0008002998|nr:MULTISPECIES: hypothetical protein [unclassified Vibrio]OBT13986.1 hypothetical protein A9260_03720 [Vibrio sp. UCD-FRSSP16_30]OBT22867.1 hypothetical protein A9264_02270 [Vibrio sp. UCD-FRSSP16_10]
MKLLKAGLFASLLCVVPFAHANDQQEAAISLMALNAGTESISTLAPKVRNVSNGVITEVELDDYKDTQVVYKFEIIDINGGNKHKLNYAVNDGALLKDKSKNLTTFGFSDLDREDRHAITQVETAQFDIIKTLIELENKYAAKTLEAELETEKGIVFYKIKLVSAQKGIQKLLVNVATGEEIPVMSRHKHK